MLPTVPSSEGRENFPEAVPVIAEIPLVLPSSEGRGKLGTTGTTVWFTVEYCQFCHIETGASGSSSRIFGNLKRHDITKLCWLLNDLHGKE